MFLVPLPVLFAALALIALGWTWGFKKLHDIMHNDPDAQNSFIRLIEEYMGPRSAGGSGITYDEFRELAAVYCSMRARDRAGVASRFNGLDGAMADSFRSFLLGPLGQGEPTDRIDGAWSQYKALGGNHR